MTFAEAVPVNKWHDSLGVSDKDVPVIGSPREVFGRRLNTTF